MASSLLAVAAIAGPLAATVERAGLPQLPAAVTCRRDFGKTGTSAPDCDSVKPMTTGDFGKTVATSGSDMVLDFVVHEFVTAGDGTKCNRSRLNFAVSDSSAGGVAHKIIRFRCGRGA